MSLDVLHARVALRERSLWDVFDLAVRFVSVHARPYALTALAALLPPFAITLLIARAGGWLLAWIAAVVLGMFARAPFTVLASRLVFEEGIGARDALRGAGRALGRLLVLRLAWMLLFVVSAIFLFIPAIWVGSAFLFVDEVLLLERASIGGAFVRSQRVAASALLDAMLAALFLVLVELAFVALADVGGAMVWDDLLQLGRPASAFTEGGSVLALAGWFAAIPYVATARFFAYLDARTRSEGWDIQTRFAALARESA